jgi:hypothetical protein
MFVFSWLAIYVAVLSDPYFWLLVAIAMLFIRMTYRLCRKALDEAQDD